MEIPTNPWKFHWVIDYIDQVGVEHENYSIVMKSRWKWMDRETTISTRFFLLANLSRSTIPRAQYLPVSMKMTRNTSFSRRFGGLSKYKKESRFALFNTLRFSSLLKRANHMQTSLHKSRSLRTISTMLYEENIPKH